MRNLKQIVSVFIIVLFAISSFSSIIYAEDHPSTITDSSNHIENKGLYLYNWTGCYNLSATAPVDSFTVYCHIPVIVDGQSPILINNVWTEPSNRVVRYIVNTNYSSSNSLLEVTVSHINKSEKLKLFWSVSCIIKENNYENLPSYIKQTPKKDLPQDVRKWLLPSQYIQSEHWRIRLRARLLKGPSNNIIDIAKKVANFTGKTIVYKGGRSQNALTTLRNGYAVCTGKANLAAALLRANGIPARVLFVYPTHFIVEYYAHPYGWVRLESTEGIMPYPNQNYTVTYCVYPQDENFFNVVNGQHPYMGVIAYWGTSNRHIQFDIDYGHWFYKLTTIFSDQLYYNASLRISKETWNFYIYYLGKNLSEIRTGYFQNATHYQKHAVYCFEQKNLNGYLENITLAYNEYRKIEEKTKGIVVGSDIIGDESSVPEILSFIEECHINMVIVDFGWITWSWNNTKFDKVTEFIDILNQRNISVWLMYRARTLQGDNTSLPHQIHRIGLVEERDICFSHQQCRDWTISWAYKLLENYPQVNGLILYNPRYIIGCCYCTDCIKKFREETKIIGSPRFFIPGTKNYEKWMEWRANEITELIKEWRDEITAFSPSLQTGVVAFSARDRPITAGQDLKKLGALVNIIFPFVVLDNVTNNTIAEQKCNDTVDIVSCKTMVDIKIYGPYTNTDSDIVNAIKSSMNSRGNGFILWNYDSLDPKYYDIQKIKDAYNGIYH